MYKLLYTREAKKQIQSLDGSVIRQIESDLLKLAKDPLGGKKLTAELSGFMSYRSGDYRIIYQIIRHEIVVLVFTVGHRKNVYHG